MRRTGNNITLSGFQVINGCKTSLILYENRLNLSDNSYIVIKLTSTEDKNLTDSIVKTMNRQTQVLNEAFETLRDFHKNLEEVYLSYDIKDRLYYERRSKQYDSEEVNKTKIISFPLQTASYVAVFLSEPHSTHRYYGEVLKSYSKRIYNENHVLEQYCMASMYVYTVNNYLKHNTEISQYKKFKFHIALILRLLASNQKLPELSNEKMKKYCDELYKKISDYSWVCDSIPKACSIIDDIIKCEQITAKDGNDITRTKEFTNQILNKVGSGSEFSTQLPHLKKGVKVKCKVQSWNNSFVYVELIDYKEHGSIHVRYINGRYISNIGDVLKESQILEATVLEEEPDSAFGYALTLL